MRAPPQPQRPPEAADLILGAAFRPRFLGISHQPLKEQGIDLVLGSSQLIAEPGMGLQIITAPQRRERIAYLHYPLVQLRFADVIAAPRDTDQLGLGHPPVDVNQESREDDESRASRQVE